MSALHRRLIWLTLFSIAMAHVEAALVVHLRTIYYADNPLEIFPLAILSQRDFNIELAREVATVVMILSLALLAEKGFTRVFAAFVYVFGLWDICYYVWLKLMIGWPQGWLEWDVLFLIPWPWFGPWITPVLIALMFVVWGGWTLSQKDHQQFTRNSIILFTFGAALALATFLLPGVRLLAGGAEAFRNFTPAAFSWILFGVGYLLMFIALWRVSTRRVEQ
ncbi:MAG: hypothetical protein OES12_07670 [Anaerolineae bacterium]|nr:hypothetical protein [Anaerolineae bacterium]